MQISVNRHQGYYWFGALLVVIGVLGLVCLALGPTRGLPVETALRLEDARLLVVTVALVLIVIGIAVRMSVRQAQN